MQKDEKYIAHALLLQFHLDKSVTEAHDTLRALYGREAVKRSTCEQYFQRFRAGDTTFVECFDYDTSSDEDSEDFVPTKIRRMFASRNASSSQRKPRISIDILADILKHLSRRRLSELEEVNTILRHTSQHRISNVHAIQSVRIYQKDDFAAYLPGNWENVTETIKCSSLKFIRFKRVELDQAFNDETYDPLDEAQNKGVIPQKTYFSKLKPAFSGAKVLWNFSPLFPRSTFELTCKYLKECASVHLHMSSYSRNDVYFNHFITQQKCGYTAPALVRLLRANVTDLYINMVDEFNKVDINHLIDELKKEFQNAVEKKCFVVTVDSYNFFRSNEPPSEFCIQNETTDEELRLIQNFETPIAPQIVALLGPQYVASCLGFDLVRQPRGQTFNRINNKCHVPLSMLHW